MEAIYNRIKSLPEENLAVIHRLLLENNVEHSSNNNGNFFNLRKIDKNTLIKLQNLLDTIQKLI